MMTIKALTLDLDDTLWPVWPAIRRAEATLIEWLRAHAPATAAAHTPETMRAIREEVMATASRAERADMGELRRRSIALALTRAGDDPALADPAYAAFDTGRQEVEFYADSLPALERLAARFPIAALTNGTAAIERVGIAHHFRFALSARSLGVAKPDPRFFHEACGRLGLAPDEVLHIGDDPHLDVAGARRAGLRAAWINRTSAAWPDALDEVADRAHHEFAALDTLADWLLEAASAR